MAYRPRIKREEFVDTVNQFQAYLTSNDKWVSEDIPSKFFDSPYEEYVDNKIISAKNTMSLWESGKYFDEAKEKLEAYEILRKSDETQPMPEAFMEKFKDWVVEYCSKEWKSFLSARRQKKLKSNRSKNQVTLASTVYYRLAHFRKDLNLSIDDAMIALLDGHEKGSEAIVEKYHLTNRHEYVAAQQRITELKDVHPKSYYMSEVISLKAKSEEFLNTEPGKQMLRNNKRDKTYQMEDQERWTNS